MTTWNNGIVVDSPSRQYSAPARVSVSYSGALAVEAISASAATKTTTDTRTVSYTEGKGFARTVKVTTTSHTGSYVAASLVTITGTDIAGAALVESVALTAVNGGESLVTTHAFATVSSIVIDPQADALGAIQVDGKDILIPKPTKQVRVGTAGSGALHVGYITPTGAIVQDTFTGCTAAEKLDIAPRWLYIDSSVQNITLLF
jgi:hypothetical protein